MQSAINKFRQDSIVTASPAQLLTMLYDRLLLDMGRAEKALRENKREEAHKQLTHAQDIIAELMSSLKMDAWEGATQLMALYVFAMKELVNANVQADADKVHEIRELFVPLCEAWHKAAEQLQTADAAPAKPKRPGGTLGVG